MSDKKHSPTPPPSSSSISYNPLNNIIIEKKNQHVITDITVITEREKKELKRSPTSFYLSSNIAGGIRDYAKVSGKPAYEIIEEAFIEYMRMHPLTQVKISVTQDLKAYSETIRDRLRNKVLREKISTTIKILQKIKETGHGKEQLFHQQLQKLIIQATKLKLIDAELMEILEEAEQLL